MQDQASEDTAPEVALRRELHRRGLRYRLHKQIVPGTRRKVDIVFPSSKVAVDVRGCFWHGCPGHGTWPKANASWWKAKIEANIARDADTERRLAHEGWELVVVWSHDNVSTAADLVERIVRRRTS